MRMKVKRIFLLLALTMPLQLAAQTNPKQGYIITNKNDTIYGTIDYLSDTKNANECRFKADSETVYKSYKPTEISGYRFADDGIYYVTKTLPVEGKEKTFFAEYLLQGGISLFHHKEGGYDYYFLIDENGKVATVKDDIPWLLLTKRSKEAKRNALREASQMLCLSQDALNGMWKHNINAETMTEVTRNYDMEYCTDAGDCVQFRYDSKTARSIVVRPRLQVGIGVGTVKAEPTDMAYDRTRDVEMNAVIPQIGIGADFLFPRASRHWTAQALGTVSYWKLSKTMMDTRHDDSETENSLKYLNLGLQLGAAYNFCPQWNISPVVRGGIAVELPCLCSINGMKGYQVSMERNRIEMGAGFYAGIGADVRLGSRQLRLTGEYKWVRHGISAVSSGYLSFCAGIRL